MSCLCLSCVKVSVTLLAWDRWISCAKIGGLKLSFGCQNYSYCLYNFATTDDFRILFLPQIAQLTIILTIILSRSIKLFFFGGGGVGGGKGDPRAISLQQA